MSIAVFVFAAVPAAIGYWLATRYRSLLWVNVVFVVVAAFGILVGSQIFMGVDLFAAFIAYLAARNHVKEELRFARYAPEPVAEVAPPPVTVNPPEQSESSGSSSSSGLWIGAVLIAFFAYRAFFTSLQPPTSPAAAQPAVAKPVAPPANVVPANNLPHLPIGTSPHTAQQPKRPAPIKESPERRDLRKCLKMSDEAAMARCLETLPN